MVAQAAARAPASAAAPRVRTQRTGRVAGHFGHELVAERAQPRDRRARRHARVVGEGRRGCPRPRAARRRRHVARTGSVRRSSRRPAGRRDTRLSGWTCRSLARQRVDLVGRHHPRADARAAAATAAGERDRRAARQRGIGRTRRGAGSTTSAAACRLARDARAPARLRGVRSARGKLRAHVLAQLVGVVGQPQQIERGHRARVQPRVADGQSVGDDRACPRAIASRQVTPPVECTSTSAAASRSGIGR